MSTMMQLEKIKPPMEDGIGVLALVAATASAEQDLSVSTGERSFLFVCDVPVYLSFSNDGNSGNITDPVESATSGSGRCMRLAADTWYTFVIQPRTRYFKAITPAGQAGYLRWYQG